VVVRNVPPTAAEFLRDHLTPGVPLVVHGGLSDWPVPPPWDSAFLVDAVGDLRVPLYDTLFTLVGLTTFSDYCERYLATDVDEPGPYLRWFASYSDRRLPWSDEAFAALSRSWHAPRWLPQSGFVFPDLGADPVVDSFPAKALFFCGRGGMTSWHVDPWHSDAYLCQTLGTKRVVIYAPGTRAPADRDGLRSVIDEPPGTLPPGWPADPLVDVVLRPGDSVFIPQDHPHAVVATTASMSISWNFVHAARQQAFRELVAGGGVEDPGYRRYAPRHLSVGTQPEVVGP
jgi:hypothetical protein